jgi:hypothetical protein
MTPLLHRYIKCHSAHSPLQESNRQIWHINIREITYFPQDSTEGHLVSEMQARWYTLCYFYDLHDLPQCLPHLQLIEKCKQIWKWWKVIRIQQDQAIVSSNAISKQEDPELTKQMVDIILCCIFWFGQDKIRIQVRISANSWKLSLQTTT